MKRKETRGGKRKGAGRPPIADKKKTVMLYVRKSVIEFHKGEKSLKEFIHKTIQIPQ